MRLKTIGILQPGHAPAALLRDRGDYDRCFRDLLGDSKFKYVSWDVEAGEIPQHIDAADGWIITGSRHGAYEDHPWTAPLISLIERLCIASRPMLGICFGHQIIARALGGVVRPADIGWVAGPTTYTTTKGSHFTINAWHRDQVVVPPAGIDIFASSQECPIAGMFHAGRLLTFQGHPEFDSNYILGLCAERGGALPEAITTSLPDRVERTRLDRDRAGKLMRGFLDRPDEFLSF